MVLAEFDAAVRDFDAAARRLREELDRLPVFKVSGPAAETAADIIAFSSVLRDTYVAAAEAIEAETEALAEALGPIGSLPDPERLARVHEIHAANWPGQHVRRLLASYKAWFYFMSI